MKKTFIVLSLFDGMSCGQIALNKVLRKIFSEKQLQFINIVYYASEVEDASILVTMKNYPNTIQLGDIRTLTKDNLPKKVDLILAGSPCQSFSASGKKNGMTTSDGKEITSLNQYLILKENNYKFEGQSYLFWEFIRIMKEVNPTYFLLENVIMSEEWRNVISNALNVLPIEINSNLVSAQNRRRLYWTNIPIPTNKLPQNKFLLFKDIVYKNDYKVFTDKRITRSKKMTKKGSYIQWDLYDKGHNSQQMRAYFADGKTCTLSKASGGLNICLDYEKDIYRKIHPIEAERLQTVPDNYTECVPDNKRFEMLGNGWTIDVISYIFEFIPDFYQNQNSN